MWKALEASRYCNNNPLHKEGHADVNVAVRFLISARLAQGDPITMKRQTRFVASEFSVHTKSAARVQRAHLRWILCTQNQKTGFSRLSRGPQGNPIYST